MQLYLIPRIGSGTSHLDPFKPKYNALLGAGYGKKEYGQQPVYLIATDLTLLQTTTLLSTALLNGGDIVQYPADLDLQLSIVDDVLPLFAAAHEDRAIPVDWMTAGMTYRVAARRVCGVMDVAQKMKINGGNSMFAIPFSENLLQYNSTTRAAFYQAMTDVGLDWSTAGVVNTDTLREALAKVVPQCDDVEATVGTWAV